MAFTAGPKGRIFGGALALSGYVRDFNASFSVTPIDVTTLADTSKQFIMGQDMSSASVNMILDTDAAAGTQWSLLTSYKGATTVTPYSLMPQGASAGDVAWLFGANTTQLTGSAPIGGSVDIAMSMETDGATDWGVVVDPLTAATVDANGTARDNGAASSNGGVACIHATAFSGLTNNIVTIEHSVDGSTAWATLVTFATITAATSERVIVAPGTTVRRYLRVVDNVTGTGSCTRIVSFARR